MAGEDFQIIAKWTCETFPPQLHDLIISPHVKQTPINLPKKVCSSIQVFFKKRVSPYFLGG